MNLPPGYQWNVAPRFHLPIDWQQRLRLSAGVEQHEGIIMPRLPWRLPLQEELSVLVSESGSGTVDLDQVLMLFHLPQHLTDRWWALLTQVPDLVTESRDHLASVATAVCDFLTFKDLRPPDSVVVNLVINSPELGVTHWDAQGKPARGLGVNLPARANWPSDLCRLVSGLWGVVNLSDRPTYVLTLSQPLQVMQDDLSACQGDKPLPATVMEFGERYLASCLDWPVVRFALAPGEGVRLPAGGLFVGNGALNCEIPDVLLLIREIDN